MKKLKDILNNAEKYSVYIICGFMLVIMSFCFIESFMHTMELRNSEEAFEGIVYHNDNFIFNALIIISLLICISFLIKYLEKIPLWIQILFMTAVVITAGTVWAFSVQLAPAEDSYMVTHAATMASEGDYSFISDNYFNTYSFQLGFVFFCQILIKIFGHGQDNLLYMEIINVVFLAASYIGLVCIMGKIFKNKRIQTLTVLTLIFCIQPVLYSSFIYGVIPGITMAIYALLFEIMYFQSEKKTKYIWGVLSAVCIALSVMIKLNNNIALIAILLLAAVKTIQKFRAPHLAYISIVLILSLSINPAVKKMYENKSGVTLKSSVPIISYISMGIHYPENVAGCTAAGWYNGLYTCALLEQNEWDADKTADISRQQIKEQIEYFSKHHREANDFFYEKNMSQWNEPTYSCIWLNAVRGKYKDPGKIAKYVCEDGADNVTEYMNIFQMFVFLCSLTGIYICIKNKKEFDIFTCSLPLIILGAFLYHMFAEGKSQYILPYFLLLCGYSSYGLNYLCTKVSTIIKRKK